MNVVVIHCGLLCHFTCLTVVFINTKTCLKCEYTSHFVQLGSPDSVNVQQIIADVFSFFPLWMSINVSIYMCCFDRDRSGQ